MDCIQKRAHFLASRDLLHINGGIFAVRAFLSEIVPPDFHWAFLIASDGDFVVSWSSRKRFHVYHGEARGKVLAQVLDEVARLDWGTERINVWVAGRVES